MSISNAHAEALVEEVKSTVRELRSAKKKDELLLARAWKICIRRTFYRLPLRDEYFPICDPVAEKIFAAWSIVWLPVNHKDQREHTLRGVSVDNMREFNRFQEEIMLDTQRAMLSLPHLSVELSDGKLKRISGFIKQLEQDDSLFADNVQRGVVFSDQYFANVVHRLSTLLACILETKLTDELMEQERIISRTLRGYIRS